MFWFHQNMGLDTWSLGYIIVILATPLKVWLFSYLANNEKIRATE